MAYTDNFNRASLGTDWTVRWGTPGIYSSTEFNGGSVGDNGAEYSAGTFADDQYCQAKISYGIGGDHEWWVMVRATHPGYVNCYAFGGSTTAASIFKLTGNEVFTSLASSTTGTLPTVGSTIKITVEGLLITGYIDGVQKLQVTDSGTTIASGKAMIDLWDDIATLNRSDDFEAGDMGTPPAAVQSQLMMMGVGP